VIFGRNEGRTLARIGILVAVVAVLRAFVFLPIRVSGPSMEPTYHDGINIVNRLAYLSHGPARGDVVAISMAEEGHSVMLMKRIVGLPGETVAFHQGRVWINGNELSEPYLQRVSDWEMAPQRLGPDKYYVVGDNRSMPQEFHVQGPAARSRIVGKVILWRNFFGPRS
jgi:signal peptidase I